jgi:lipopolysaccharide export system permease protein
MRILDRERYRAFFKAYVICFIALVGLYVVIDAFANLDEFSEVAGGAKLFRNMGRYYLVRMSLFYDRLCGVIIMMAAIFTVTWMQRNNELLALLAAGIGTTRAIRPVLIAAVLVNFAAVANQEWIIPEVAEELQKPPDDDGKRSLVLFHSREDLRGIVINGGKEGDRATQTVTKFTATLPVALLGTLGGVEAKQARYIAADDPGDYPWKGGWLLRGAVLTPPGAPIDGPPAGEKWLVRLGPEELKKYPPPLGNLPDLGGESFFLRTNVTFTAVTRDRQWFRYAATPELIRALGDPANEPERLDIAVFLHGRIVRPLWGLTLLFLGLPLVLGGDGRNMFINLGLSLGASALFYASCFLSQYLGVNGVLAAELAAWLPLIGFGTLAAARWDTIRT